MMQASVQGEDTNWDKYTKKIERDVNTSVNKTTGKTPFELLYGYMPRFDDGNVRLLTGENETYRIPNEIREEVKANIEIEQKKYKDRYDKQRFKGITYNLGDIVYVKRNVQTTGESTKLQPRFKGPLKITNVLPSDTYEISPLMTKEGKNLKTTAHVSQLKIWKNMNSQSDDDEEE